MLFPDHDDEDEDQAAEDDDEDDDQADDDDHVEVDSALLEADHALVDDEAGADQVLEGAAELALDW